MSQLIENTIEQQIYTLIQKNPGLHLSKIAEQLNMRISHVEYHLLYLEKNGIDMSSFMPDGFDYGGIIFEPVWYGYLDLESVVVSIVLTLIIAMLASLIPSWKTVNMKPVEVMR